MSSSPTFPPSPERVYYSTGRMLGVEDFPGRGRLPSAAGLARFALMQVCGTGTVSGLLVKNNGATDPTQT